MQRRSSAVTSFMTLVLLLGAGVASAMGTSVTVEETDLRSYGDVLEVHGSPDGQIVISDYAAQELRLVDPGADEYTAYDVGHVVDAKSDGAGHIWWTDAAWTFSVLSTSTNLKETWTLEDRQLYGTALDGTGKVWFSEWYGARSKLYSFDPATTELCAYGFETQALSYSYYVLHGGGYLWMLNWYSDYVVRFDPETLAVKRWDVGSISALEQGMAVDGLGRLWWADRAGGQLSRLDPATDELTDFALPVGTEPVWVGVWGNAVWYTESAGGTVGTLTPQLASGSVSYPTPTDLTATESCSTLGEGIEQEVTSSTGTVTWASDSLVPVVDADGWVVYELAEGAEPFGLAPGSGYQWITDPGRQKLVRFSAPLLPGISLEKYTNGEDADAAPGPTIQVGEEVVWTYVVENSGEVDLTDVTVVDDNGTPGEPADDYECPIGELAVGMVNDTCTQVGAAVEGEYGNTARVTATYGGSEVWDEDSSHYTGTSSYYIYLPLVLKN